MKDISGLGLRHVGYAIPAELFAPFVSSAVKVFSTVTTNETAIAGFTWAMQLVSKTLDIHLAYLALILGHGMANQLPGTVTCSLSLSLLFSLSLSTSEGKKSMKNQCIYE
jgi:hypothetical protein